MNQKEFTEKLNTHRGNVNSGDVDWSKILDESFNADGAIEKIGIAQEECAELIQALSKQHRYQTYRMGVLEEMADVHISLEYVRMAMGFTYDDLMKAIDIKLEREWLRLKDLKDANKEEKK